MPARWSRPGSTGSRWGPRRSDAASLRRLGRRHRADGRGRGRRGGAGGGDPLRLAGPAVRRPGQSAEAWGATLDAALALAPDHVSAYALTLDDPDDGGADRAARRSPADAAGSPPVARGRGRRAGRGPRGGRSTRSPSTAWARPGIAATRSPTGPCPGTRAGTTSSTGSGARTRRSVRERTRSTGSTRRWNAARLDGYLAALAPAGGRRAVLPPGGSETGLGRRRRRRGGDPRPPPGHRAVADGGGGGPLGRTSPGRWGRGCWSASARTAIACASAPAAACSRTSCSGGSSTPEAGARLVDDGRPRVVDTVDPCVPLTLPSPER